MVATKVDLMSFSAHKIYGPKGVGVLFVGSDVLLKPLMHGGGQERGLRPGTEALPLIVGMAKAIELLPQFQEKLPELRMYRETIQSQLREAFGNDLKIYSDVDSPIPILTIMIEGIRSEDLIVLLDVGFVVEIDFDRRDLVLV